MKNHNCEQPSNLMLVPSIIGGLIVATGLMVAAPPVLAAPQRILLKNTPVSIIFNPPRTGAPTDTRGGASRGNDACSQDASSQQGQQFTALMPSSSYGLTLVEHPTFLAYIPPTSAQEVFFTLKDEGGYVHYQSTLPIPTSGGIIRVTLPDTVPGLAVGKSYQWGMAILCTGRLRPDSPFISNWVQRIEPVASLTNQFNAASPLERAALYGTNGIWYDTLATLAELRIQQPDNSTLVSTWQSLLESVELGRVATAPLLN